MVSGHLIVHRLLRLRLTDLLRLRKHDTHQLRLLHALCVREILTVELLLDAFGLQDTFSGDLHHLDLLKCGKAPIQGLLGFGEGLSVHDKRILGGVPSCIWQFFSASDARNGGKRIERLVQHLRIDIEFFFLLVLVGVKLIIEAPDPHFLGLSLVFDGLLHLVHREQGALIVIAARVLSNGTEVPVTHHDKDVEAAFLGELVRLLDEVSLTFAFHIDEFAVLRDGLDAVLVVVRIGAILLVLRDLDRDGRTALILRAQLLVLLLRWVYLLSTISFLLLILSVH